MITNGAGAAIVTLVIMTNGYSFLSASSAGSLAWVSHLLAGALSLFLLWLFASACKKYPKKTLIDVLEVSFGKVLSRGVALVLAALTLMTCIVSLTLFSRFVQITALPRTPQIIIPLIVALISAFAIARGAKPIAGAARLLIWFFAAVFIIFICLHLGNMELSPMQAEISQMLRGTGEAFLNRFGALFALMAVYTRMESEGRDKFFFGAAAGSTLALSALAFITVSVLGADTAAADFYPVYTVMSVGSVGGFVQHTEVLACIAMTLALFFKCAVCLIFANDMISGVFGVKDACGVKTPLALIVAAGAQLIYRDLGSLRGMLEWKAGAVAVVAIYVLIPVAVLTSIRIKSE